MTGIQFDWVQEEAKKEARKRKRLMELREILRIEIERDLPFSRSAIRVTLAIIRQEFGQEVEMKTRDFFKVDQAIAA